MWARASPLHSILALSNIFNSRISQLLNESIGLLNSKVCFTVLHQTVSKSSPGDLCLPQRPETGGSDRSQNAVQEWSPVRTLGAWEKTRQTSRDLRIGLGLCVPAPPEGVAGRSDLLQLSVFAMHRLSL